jgi:hypothetical protein
MHQRIILFFAAACLLAVTTNADDTENIDNDIDNNLLWLNNVTVTDESDIAEVLQIMLAGQDNEAFTNDISTTNNDTEGQTDDDAEQVQEIVEFESERDDDNKSDTDEIIVDEPENDNC